MAKALAEKGEIKATNISLSNKLKEAEKLCRGVSDGYGFLGDYMRIHYGSTSSTITVKEFRARMDKIFKN